MFKRAVKFILITEARLVLWRFRPKIIAITGSVGKTSVKEAVYAVLSKKFRVRKSPKSYNSEFGVPLTILGLETEWHSWFGWAKNIIKGIAAFLTSEYPELLVLEMGVERPGDLDYLLTAVTPYVSVVTAIGEVPVHVEFFSGPQSLAFEKGKIVRRTMRGGYTVLNHDDEVVRAMRVEARGTVTTFGFGKGSNVAISQYKLVGSEENPLEGITCKIDYQGSTVPLKLRGVFGKQQAYAAAAAVAVGVAFKMNLLSIVEALAEGYQPLPGRLRLIEGVKGTWILDDSYNASPMAMHAALDLLHDAPVAHRGRKIAVLGDMLEIGKFTIQAHQAMGELARSIVDILFVVGPRAKFIAKEARERGMDPSRIFEFSRSEDAGQKIQEVLASCDMVLVKGSQAMRMEKIVEEIMAHPEDAKELLCRQETYWKGV